MLVAERVAGARVTGVVLIACANAAGLIAIRMDARRSPSFAIATPGLIAVVAIASALAARRAVRIQPSSILATSDRVR